MGFLILICFGVLTALIARNKGRSAVAWFLIGFFFHVLGLVIVLVVSNLKQQQIRQERLRRENRRLKEKIRKNRMVADQRYKQINNRIGAHDRVLGVDTDTEDPAMLESESRSDISENNGGPGEQGRDR